MCLRKAKAEVNSPTASISPCRSYPQPRSFLPFLLSRCVATSAMATSGEFVASMLGGGAAGTMVDVVLYPLDTIKTRLQSEAGFLRSGGFKGVYRGLSSAAAGSAPCGTVAPGDARVKHHSHFSLSFSFAAVIPLTFSDAEHTTHTDHCPGSQSLEPHVTSVLCFRPVSHSLSSPSSPVYTFRSLALHLCCSCHGEIKLVFVRRRGGGLS